MKNIRKGTDTTEMKVGAKKYNGATGWRNSVCAL